MHTIGLGYDKAKPAAAQIENEYGFCGFNDKAYLRHLVDTAREALGPEAVLFTTDPPQVAPIGSLDGEEVLTCAPASRPRAYRNPIPAGLCMRARAPGPRSTPV